MATIENFVHIFLKCHIGIWCRDGMFDYQVQGSEFNRQHNEGIKNKNYSKCLINYETLQFFSEIQWVIKKFNKKRKAKK